MLLQLIINIIQLHGTALRIFFIVPAVLFLVSILFLKGFPSSGSYTYTVLAGAVYPVFVFLIGGVHPFSDHPEGSLRLALFLEILFLVMAFWTSRVALPRTILSVLCVYMLSWLFFSKIPVSFSAMSDFLFLIVPCAFVIIMGDGAAPDTSGGSAKHEGPELMDYNDEMYRIISDNWDRMEVEGTHGERFVYDKNTNIWTKNGHRVDPGRLGLDDPSRIYGYTSHGLKS